MIEQVCTVVGVEGEFVWVEAERRSECGACSSAGGCGASVLSGLFGRRPARLKSHNSVGAQTGDRVVVAVQEAAFTRTLLTVYLVPIGGLLAGAALGHFSSAHLLGIPADLQAIGLGALGLSAGIGLSRRLAARGQVAAGMEPVVVRKLTGRLPLG